MNDLARERWAGRAVAAARASAVRASTPPATPIVLAAHGSRDPRAAAATCALARAVAAARPGAEVIASYLDHSRPRPAQALAALEAAGHSRATVVPLLLTAAYHSAVDIPAEISAARRDGLRMAVNVTDVLGPAHGVMDGLLLAALRRRLAGAATARTLTGPAGLDAIVLAAAGTRDAAARRTVDVAAAALGASLGLPCLAAYASAAAPTPGDAVGRLRAEGATRVGVAAYFLAPGRLYETGMESARAAGAVTIAAPLADAPEVAALVVARLAAAEQSAATRPKAA